MMTPCLKFLSILILSPTVLWGNFSLVQQNQVAGLRVSKVEPTQVLRAVGDLQKDILSVTGLEPGLNPDVSENGRYLIVGQLGKGGFVDQLVNAGLLNVSLIEGQWEAFLIQEVNAEKLGLGTNLVIAGSDMRGTIYGIYEISRRIGVSPWYWWADVPVAKNPDVSIDARTPITGAPSVKYRGIFINDEDWGLEPWAAKTFEPEVGNLGPKSYAKVFELLLRLRANTIWPGMHPCTTAFHKVPGNAKVADEYGIVLGSSHAEPMLRNNVGEWTGAKEHYNFLEHRDEVVDYWQERVKERVNGESIFTLGMRGIHDSAIVGPKTQEERIATLEDVFETQRDLLATWLGDGDVTRVGQMFCPYKEVLDDYNAGLRVPDDVIIVWPDDNFGYVRRFATPDERKRSGGLGVYYHLSYLGSPHSWLWFDTQPLALVWSEMYKAYETGADALWIGNVGDIKGNERSMEFFLNLAWNADSSGVDFAHEFMLTMAARDFGPQFAEAIVDLWSRHAALAFARKPEHLQWHFPLTPNEPTTLTEREIRERLDTYADLAEAVDSVEHNLPADLKDAFYELVAYPIRAAQGYNIRYFSAELARKLQARGDQDAAESEFAKVQPAMERVENLTRQYNQDTAGGKWNHIMSINGVDYEDWLVRYQPAREIPPLDDPECMKVVLADERSPDPSPMPRPEGARSGDFVERDRVVSIFAGHFTHSEPSPDGGEWKSVPGLGRTASAVTVLPSTIQIKSDEGTPRLHYRFHIQSGGETILYVRLLPTFPIVQDQGLRFAVSLDDGAIIPVTITDGFNTRENAWKNRVLQNAATATVYLPKELTPGWHTLQLVAVDTGVVVDKFVIDLGGYQPSYDGPKETRIE